MPATYLYINDSGGTTWKIGVNLLGEVSQPVTTSSMSPLGIVLQDSVTSTWYKVVVVQETVDSITFETLSIVPSSPWLGGQAPYMQDSGGNSWQLVVAGGMLGCLPFTPQGAIVGFPQIIWPSAAAGGEQAGANTLLLTSWPRFQPAPLGTGAQQMNYEADVALTIFSSGSGQAAWKRTDNFFEGVMDFVPAGAPTTSGGPTTWVGNVGGWYDFMLYALGFYLNTLGPGGDFPFDYYPNSLASAFSTFVLEDDVWKPAYRQPGYYTFPLRWRSYVTP